MALCYTKDSSNLSSWTSNHRERSGPSWRKQELKIQPTTPALYRTTCYPPNPSNQICKATRPIADITPVVPPPQQSSDPRCTPVTQPPHPAPLPMSDRILIT
ncbi:hypothetical protein HBI71_068450 [Parastagonospora nodorum]|nr:hypothetical protein HBI71_068450 [Parastagonospora nodorum]